MLDYSTPGALDEAAHWRAGSNIADAATPDIEDVGVEDALRLIETVPGLAILDVRTAVEHAEGRISGAVNIDFYQDEFEQHLAALDRGTPYLLYCRCGGRSAFTLDIMRRLGFTRVAHMVSGIEGWTDAGLPVRHG